MSKHLKTNLFIFTTVVTLTYISYSVLPAIPATAYTMMIALAVQSLIFGMPLGLFIIRIIYVIVLRFKNKGTLRKVIILKTVIGFSPIVYLILSDLLKYHINPSAMKDRLIEFTISLFIIAFIPFIILFISKHLPVKETMNMKEYFICFTDSMICVIIGWIPMMFIYVMVTTRMYPYETWSPLDVYLMEGNISNVITNILFFIIPSAPLSIGSSIASAGFVRKIRSGYMHEYILDT